MVRLLNFVEEHHRIRPTAHRLAQLSALFVADVSRRRSHQSGHGVLLHVFGHIDTHHRLIVIEQKLGQGSRQLGLADASGTQKDERPDRTARIPKPRTRPPHGIGHRLHRFGLPHHPGGQALLHAHQFGPLTLQHSLHRDARPRGHYLGDVFLGHLLAQQRGGSSLFGSLLFHRGQLLLQAGDAPILDFRRLVEIPLATRLIQFLTGFFQLALQEAHRMDDGLLVLPLGRQRPGLLLQIGQFGFELLQALATGLVFLLGQRRAFDLILQNLAIQPIQLGRLRIEFHLQPRGRLVHQIHRLVG